MCCHINGSTSTKNIMMKLSTPINISLCQVSQRPPTIYIAQHFPFQIYFCSNLHNNTSNIIRINEVVYVRGVASLENIWCS